MEEYILFSVKIILFICGSPDLELGFFFDEKKISHMEGGGACLPNITIDVW